VEPGVTLEVVVATEVVREAVAVLVVAPEAVVEAAVVEAAVEDVRRPAAVLHPVEAPAAPGVRPGQGLPGWLERLGRRYRCNLGACSCTSCMASGRCICCGVSLLDKCRTVVRSGRVCAASLDGQTWPVKNDRDFERAMIADAAERRGSLAGV
jgi:hypothetical protein